MCLAPGELIEPPLPPRRLTDHLAVAGLLLVLIGLVVFTRWWIGRVAAECDQSLYICFGHLLLHGQRLYTDLLDHKPPLIYLVYALAEKLTGFGDQEAVLLSATGNAIVLGGVYAAARQLGHSVWAGVFAAAVWAATCNDLSLVGYAPNTELFLNGCLAWGFALLLESRPHLGRNVGAGLAFAIGSLFKHVVAPAAAVLVLADLLCPTPLSTVRERFNRALVIGGVGVLAWALVAGYFAVRGRFHDFYTMVFVFNVGYLGEASYSTHHASGMLNNLAMFADGVGSVPPTFPIGVLLLVGAACLGAIGTTLRDRVMFVALSLGCAVAIALPGQYFNHYFQLLLPPFAIGSGTAVTTLFPHDFSRAGSMLRARLGSVLLVALFFSQGRDVLVLRQTRDLSETRTVGLYLGRILHPDQQLFVWGSLDAPLYQYSGHMPPFGIMVERPVFEYPQGYPTPLVSALRRRVDGGLLASRPALIAVEAGDAATFHHDDAIAPLIAAHYRRWHGSAIAGARELYWREDIVPPTRVLRP